MFLKVAFIGEHLACLKQCVQRLRHEEQVNVSYIHVFILTVTVWAEQLLRVIFSLSVLFSRGPLSGEVRLKQIYSFCFKVIALPLC